MLISSLERKLTYTTYLPCIQHNNHELERISSVASFRRVVTKISFKDLKLVSSRSFKMNRQETHMGSSFYVGGMRGTLKCDNSMSPKSTGG
jgi:hypothetical protein